MARYVWMNSLAGSTTLRAVSAGASLCLIALYNIYPETRKPPGMSPSQTPPVLLACFEMDDV